MDSNSQPKMQTATIEGIVEHGRALGRTIGVPTANVAINIHSLNNIKLRTGVYRSIVIIGTTCYNAVTHIGTNPTAGGNALRSESHIFDFDQDIYYLNIQVKLFDYIRGEISFPDMESLVARIKLDIQIVRSLNETDPITA